MNVTFKLMRRSGDRAYILSEITNYEEGLPVVLVASTEKGVRIPSDVFPFVNEADLPALESALSDTALAARNSVQANKHAKNSPAVRFFVVVLPWLAIKRWVLEFRAIDAQGNIQSSCTNNLDVDTFRLRNRLDMRKGIFRGDAIEGLSKSFIHDRIQISFVRAIELKTRLLVSAAIDMPYHAETNLEFDFLDKHGCPISPDYNIIEDSVMHGQDYGSVERRHLELSFSLPKADAEVCVCATDAQGTIAPGFAMLGKKSLDELLASFSKQYRTAYNDPNYDAWYRQHHRVDLPTLFEQVSVRFEHEPLISVVCILETAKRHQIHDVMNAFLTQSYGNWELIFVNVSGSTVPVTSLLEVFQDDRMYLVDVDPNLSRTEKINTGIYAAEGEYIGCLFAQDLISSNALFECVRTINEHPACDLLYFDSDTVDVQGYHSHPQLRPDYSPELLRSFNYMGNFVIYSESLLEQIGLLDSAYEGVLSYDLNLRASEKAREVCHIPRVLYHRRFASALQEEQLYSAQAQEAGRKALVAHFKRVGMNVEVLNLDMPFRYQVRHVLAQKPKVSVVVAHSGGPLEQLERCIKHLYQQINYANFEVVVIEIGQADQAVQECLNQLKGRYETLLVLEWKQDYNRASIMNFAARELESEYLFFITDDTRILNPDALHIMLGYFQDPRVGVVGCRKLYLDGTIEHSGLVVGGSNIVTPLSRYMSSSWAGYLGRCAVSHNVSAVAADCMFISRKVFEAVGGFSEELSIAYSDVDFCLKARQQGYYTVYTPFATLTHFRSVSRLRSYSQAFLIKQKREAALLQYRWPDYFVKGDRYYSSNFDPNSPYYGLRDN